jgi:hypothetical protein
LDKSFEEELKSTVLALWKFFKLYFMACWAINRSKITQKANKIRYRTLRSYDSLASLAIHFLHSLFSFFAETLGATSDEVRTVLSGQTQNGATASREVASAM